MGTSTTVEAGTFNTSFPYPEYYRLGYKKVLISGEDGWRKHVAEKHRQRLTKALGVSKTKRGLTIPQETCCVWCGEIWLSRKGASNHFSSRQVDKGIFDHPTNCPECERHGRLVCIENEDAWWRHVAQSHSPDGKGAVREIVKVI